jgi:class 3 adenylate cyclase
MKRRSKAGDKASKARGRDALKTKRREAPKTASSSAPIQDGKVARLTRELNEARAEQTAASEVLRVISSSPGQLDSVFQTILANATRICGANFGILNLHENGSWPAAAMHNVPHAFIELRRREPMLHFDPEHPLERLAATKRIMRITDLRTTAGYKARDPAHVTMVEVAGVRTVLLVPMLKDSELIGAITIYRQEVRPFAEKQIELVENFAAQAVIAIENARLLNELRQSLEQQTATADVLKVISGSLGDLQPVFRAMLANAVKICDAKFGNLLLFEDRAFRTVAVHGAPQPYLDERTREPIIRISPGSDLDRLVKTKQAIHVPDIRVGGMASGGAIIELANARTMLSVPMLKENDLVGAIGIYRQEIRPFTDKQIDLVKNFAAQAVIAIENARLLNELHQRTTDLTEALEQQTATSEVLQVISSSPGLLEEVFASMLEKAVRICDAAFGNIYRWDGTLLHLVANHNTPPAWVEYRKQKPYRADNPFAIARMINSKAPVHVTDLSDEYYTEGVRLGEIKTFLAVPMLNGDDLIGAFIVSRKEVRPFTDKQIALVHNFAAQAVIAIENARLLKELRDRTTEVERLNKHLEQRVTDQVGEIERMGRLRRFLPPQVADLIVASGTEKQLESHRRKITALFCDLRGFTGFTESADAEDVIVLLREYHAAIGEKIIKYSGTLERYAGDGVMVVFNDPVPVDNPALQAVLMALEMRDAIGALTETWHRWGHDIGFGIGIAHGFATLGTIGFEGRFDYAAIGTVSNVASRLCDEAKPGQILISPRVLTKVENAVTVEPVGEFELKGIRRPLAAYNVLAANPY